MSNERPQTRLGPVTIYWKRPDELRWYEHPLGVLGISAPIAAAFVLLLHFLASR